MSDSLWPHGLYPTRLLCPQNSPGKNTGVGWHFLLQGIFPSQGSNMVLLHCRQTFPTEPSGKPQLFESLERAMVDVPGPIQSVNGSGPFKPSMQLALHFWGFSRGSDGKESACSARDLCSIPGSGRSPGEGNDYPLQYSWLENSMNRGYSPWDPKELDMTERLIFSLWLRSSQGTDPMFSPL